MNKVTVAILDSGIDREHPAFQNIDIQSYGYMAKENTWSIDTMKPVSGHGTAVASVILKYTKDVDLISMRIFDDESNEAETEVLIHALEFINDNLKCDVINISLGVVQNKPELEKVCIDLKEKGVLLVAAFCNEGLVSFPAAYDSVIGVDATTQLKNFNQHIYVENSMIDIGMANGNQRVAWLEPPYVIVRGNSFVTPIVTAKICTALLEGIAKEKMEMYLYDTAINKIKFENANTTNSKLFPIKNAAIFPYNKEIKSFVKFSHLLPFHIKAVYDSRLSGQVGLEISGTKTGSEFKIKNIDECDLSNIDTFIIGHTAELSFRANKDYKDEIIQLCIEHNINIVSFDPIEKTIPDHINVYIPGIWRDKYSSNKFGKLYKVFSPVLGVAGTSSQQGKFTLQLRLRELFASEGYTVGQLSSEPEGELFGMDCVFPYGYASNLNITGYDVIEHVNALIHQIDVKCPDIILVGSQSGVCTVSYNHLSTYGIDSMHFMLGAKPDAVVLCINYHDTLDIIQRSISYIQSLAACKVVALCVFPLAFEDEWHAMRNIKKVMSDDVLVEFCELVYEKTGIPCYKLGNSEDEKNMYQKCIDFFLEEV